VVRRAEAFREKQGIDLRTGHLVTAIDRRRRTVAGTTTEGRAFEQAYDKLMIATGAAAVVPDLPGFDLPGVLPLKTLEDGRRIKALIAGGKIRSAVILGMGYIAMEMGEALRSLGIAVEMVKPNPVFLPGMAPELAAVVRRELESHGVGVHAGQRIERVEARGGSLAALGPGFGFSAQLVLVAIGVKPNSELARRAGLDLSVQEAVAVDRSLCTADPDIFSAGDCADALHVVTGKKTWIPLALRANRAGWAVADNVCGGRVELDGVAGTAVFRVFGLEVARTGLNLEAARQAGFDPVETTIQSSTRAHSFPGTAPLWVSAVGDRGSGRLLGMQIVGRESAAHRINAAAVALHAGLTVAQFAQTDLAYAPPFGPSWDPMLTAATQLLKKMGGGS
jgi:NADPH-dependent 2,4-dienoyl-CoA reductase/sulfur reductase-like enzyme